MGVLECHQLTPPNKMVELKKPWAVCEKSGWIHGAISWNQSCKSMLARGFRLPGSPGPKGACLCVRTWNPNPASWGLQVLVVVSGTERVGFSKQDAHGNLVVKTLISVSGHETQSMAIPKLGKTQISVSGHETRSNHWIFPFLFLKKYKELWLIS